MITLIAALLVLPAPLSMAQGPLLEYVVYGVDYKALSNIGDVNGDGVDELVIGAPGAAGTDYGGRCYVLSGADGSIVHDLLGSPPYWAAGGGHGGLGSSTVAMGDINGDGVDDFGVGCLGHTFGTVHTGAIHMYSGVDAAELYTIRGTATGPLQAIGRGVEEMGDVDGDGVQDLIVRAPGFAAAGTVVSGASGTVLYSHSAGPYRAAPAGDVNQDGFGDYVIGESSMSTVYSGIDGSVLYTATGNPGGTVGDMDGDGVRELHFGAPTIGAGEAYVVSGRTGVLLRAYLGSAIGDEFGTVTAAVGDINLDGVEDLGVSALKYVGSGLYPRGQYQVFSGADGSVLSTVDGPSTTDHLGLRLLPASDINGDGIVDVCAPTENYPIDHSVVIRIYSGWNIFTNVHCAGGTGGTCPCGNPGDGVGGCLNSAGESARIGGQGSASVTLDDLSMECSGLPPSIPALLFAGDQSVNGGAGALFGDGLLCAGGAVQRLGISFSDAVGGASWPAGVTGQFGWSAGDAHTLQIWYRDLAGPCSTGFNTSNALEVIVTP